MAVVAGGAASAHAFPFSPTNGKLIFVSDRDSVDANGDGIFQNSERNRDIYSVNPDGTGLARLTSDPSTDIRPDIAPDGRRIAFTSNRLGDEDLFVMRADGSQGQRVTDRGAPDREPSFSADGQRLAYSVRHASTLPSKASEGDIWTVNLDGTETTRLTFDRQLDEFDPAFSPDGSKIAFVSAVPGGPATTRDILVMDADGSDLTNLTAGNGGSGFEDADPAFSPDGSSIAFTSDRGGGTEIWVMGTDGGSPRQLTNAGGRDEHPTFSPDGSSIAFTARRGGSTDVYTMNTDGSGQTKLTDDAPLNEADELSTWQPVPPAGQLEAYVDSGPAIFGSSSSVGFTYSGAPSAQLEGFRCSLDGESFRPCPASGRFYSNLADGSHRFRVVAVGSGAADPAPAEYRFEIDTSRVVFAADGDGDTEIYSMNADGSGRLRLTANNVADTDPALSPDGRRVAFASERDGDFEIYVTNADGSGALQQLTDNAASDRSPAFSHDGSKIAFTSRRDGNLEVYAAAAADGKNPTNLTNHPADDSVPSFSGSGSRITFESNRAAGNEDIYTIRDDGSGLSRLTTAPEPDTGPDYSPDGGEIVFARDVDGGDGLPTNDEVWIMDADGSGQKNITNHPRGIDDREPSFSPSGEKVAYSDQGDIYIQSSDGTARTRLTADLSTESVPDWGSAPTEDRDPPDTTITSGPAQNSTTSSNDPSFSFIATEFGSSFECRLDGAPFAPCTTPKDYVNVGDGRHTFEVRAIDPAGNADGSPASRTWTIDTSTPDNEPPETTIDSGPGDGSRTNDNDPSFSFSSSEGASSYECRLDGAAYAPCTSPRAYANLPDGTHTFRVRATDQAGNTDPTPASRTWTIDTTSLDSEPPDTRITSGPAQRTAISNDHPGFGFVSTEAGSSFECRLDAGPFAPCTSPRSYVDLPEGDHTFAVRATDPAGNTDPTPASLSFTVDMAVRGFAVAKRTQSPRGKKIAKIKIKAKEALSVRLRGKVRVGGDSYKLKSKKASLRAGKRKRLKLKTKKKNARKISAALDGGADGKAKVKVVLIDEAGNKKKRRVGVRLSR